MLQHHSGSTAAVRSDPLASQRDRVDGRVVEQCGVASTPQRLDGRCKLCITPWCRRSYLLQHQQRLDGRCELSCRSKFGPCRDLQHHIQHHNVTCRALAHASLTPQRLDGRCKLAASLYDQCDPAWEFSILEAMTRLCTRLGLSGASIPQRPL